MIDRQFYLPKSWTEDDARRVDAGVPDDVEFATKPALAADMITRAMQAKIPARWAAGDEVYGADPGLRTRLHTLSMGYVLAIGSNRAVTTEAGTGRVDDLTRSLPPTAWQRLSAGTGTKGQRWYSWALVAITDDAPLAATPTIGLAVDTRPSLALRTAALYCRDMTSRPSGTCRRRSRTAAPIVPAAMTISWIR